MDDNSFANLVGRLNAIDAAREPHEKQFKPKETHIKEGMMRNDMTSILENMYRDIPFESAKQVSTKEFQKGYKPKQLPADYKMPDVGPVLGTTKQLKNPTKGYLVGEDAVDVAELADGVEEIEIDIKDYDKNEYDQEGANAKDHLARAADAALELQGILDDDENLPEWVQGKIIKALDYLDISRDYMKQELGEEYKPHKGSEESWDGVNPSTAQTLATNNQGYEGPVAPEGEVDPTQLTKITKEDSLGKKKSIMDYLSDVERKRTEDMIEPVKTFTTDDGKKMKIYGSEDDGYRVKVNGKESKKSFGKLADAVLACETFIQRSNDYVSDS